MWSGDYSSSLPSKPAPAGVNLPRDSDGNSYLHELCRKDAPLELIREAIEQLGADVNAANKKNIPPLGIAIAYAKPATVACLLGAGAELYFPAGKEAHFNAVQLAAALGKEETLTLVLANDGGLHVNDPGIGLDGSRSPLPALHIAVKNSNGRLVGPLVAAGAFVNAEAGTEQATPLFLAIANNSESLVRRLVEAGADLERPHPGTGRTPLLHAACQHEASAGRTLLQYGANPNATDAAGMAPLAYAAANEDFALAESLIQHGADVNFRHAKTGETPLMQAAQKGAGDVVRLLLKNGADPMLADAFNRTALKYAEDKHRLGTRSSLEEAEKHALQAHFENVYKKYRP